MTFVGEYEHTLDAKNRVFMPARFREQLGESFFVTRKMNKNCLAVYTCEKMDQIADLINGFPDSEVSEIKEFLFSKSVQASPDSNGRIVLPQQILDYASIERDVAIIGAGDHIQIWNASMWREATRHRQDPAQTRLDRSVKDGRPGTAVFAYPRPFERMYRWA